MSRDEYLRWKRLMDGAGRTASGCVDDGTVPAPTPREQPTDLCLCGRLCVSAPCWDCSEADDRYWRNQ